MVTPDGKAPVPSFVNAIAADALISALTIAPSVMFALATLIPLGKFPVASLDKPIAALLLTSAF